jgi:hypothetical protein
MAMAVAGMEVQKEKKETVCALASAGSSSRGFREILQIANIIITELSSVNSFFPISTAWFWRFHVPSAANGSANLFDM